MATTAALRDIKHRGTMMKFPEVPYFTVEKETNNRNFTSTVLYGGCEVFVPVLKEAWIPQAKAKLVEFANKQRKLLTPEPSIA